MIADPQNGSKQGDVLDSAGPFDFVGSIDVIHPASEGATLFGNGGASFTDVYQGLLGDCWFMHAQSCVAQKPERLEKIFLNTEISNNGVYGLNMYMLGVPTTVVIDDIMPVNNIGSLAFA